jgi:hypothetical protein
MRRFCVLFGVFLCAFLIGSANATAQVAGGSEVLDPGGHTLSWTGTWTKDVQSSVSATDFEGILLQGDSKLFGVVVYANTASGAELRDVFVDSFATTLGNYATIDSGSDRGIHYELGSGSDVMLYAVFIDGGLSTQSLGYFVVAPTASFASAVQAIQRDFTLDGAMVLKGVDGAGLQQRAGGGAPAGVTTTTNTAIAKTGTSNTTTTTTVAQVPDQRAIDDTVTVGATQVGWTGPWVYETDTSSTTQATFTQFDQATGSIKLVSYGEVTNVTSDAGTAVETYAQTFLASVSAANVLQLDGGTLANGTEWRLYRFDLQGNDLAFIVTGSQSASGAFVVSTVTSNAPMLTFTLMEAQEQFTLNGTTPLFDGVDPILTTLMLFS